MTGHTADDVISARIQGLAGISVQPPQKEVGPDKPFRRLHLNECPFPPAPKVVAAMQEAASALNCYPDHEGTALAYGVGHCAVIVVAGTFTELVQRYLDWNEQSRGLKVLKCTCGILVLLGGVYLIYTAH